MFNTSNNYNNNTRILEFIKYSVPCYFFTLSHTWIQYVTLTTSEGIFYLPYFISRGCLHFYRFQKSVFKNTPVVLQCTTMQVLVEGAMYVSQGKIPMSTEGMLIPSRTVPDV